MRRGAKTDPDESEDSDVCPGTAGTFIMLRFASRSATDVLSAFASVRRSCRPIFARAPLNGSRRFHRRRTQGARGAGVRPPSLASCFYIQTPDVPFHVRPAFSQSLGDPYIRSGRSVEARGAGGIDDCIDECID